jgi:carbon-monoxide dehydrogenase medium subunit
MMPLRRFTIHQPKTALEACDMLAEFGEKGRLYAGGTELLLAMKHDLLRYEHLIDIKTISNLDRIERRNGAVVIGSAATHRAIEHSAVVRENLPVVAEMEAAVANPRVRACGTLGGNLGFAEPHSDPATLLVALGATVNVTGKAGTRSIAIANLLTGAYETCLGPDEIMISVEIPVPAKSQRAAYLKFQLKERPTLGLGLVVDVASDTITKAVAVVGSVSAVPTQSDIANGLLVGSTAAVEKRLADAAQALGDAADPVDDLEGSAEYKRHLIGVFLKRAFAKALA